MNKTNNERNHPEGEIEPSEVSAPQSESHARQIIETADDITRHKQIEEALQREHCLLQSVMNGAKNSHLVYLDREFNFVRVNAAYAATCGYRPEEMIGKNHFALYPNAENEVIFARVRDTGEPFEILDKPFEFPDQPERGTTYWDWTLSPVKDATGQVEGLVLSLFEITQRKRAEETLRESQDRLSHLADNLPNAMVYQLTAEPEGSRRFIYVSRAVERLNEVRTEDVLADASTIYKQVLPEYHALVREREEEARWNLATLRVEVQSRLPSGSLRWFEYASTPRYQADGLLVWDGVEIDITEHKRAEAEKEKLEAQNRQLQKSESLGRMAGAIAHHFNNQLQAVMMNLNIAMRDCPSGEASTESLSEAMQAARKAAEVSSLMLTYLGQTHGKLEVINLAVICQQNLSLLRAVLPQGVRLETNFASPGPVINANTNQIQQVLNILVTNAWEALKDARGDIRLSVKTADLSEISMANRFPVGWRPQAQSYACIEVADNGCGITAIEIEKVFDPFYSTKFSGRGMGLPVVLGIAKIHDGSITVDSEPGRGSVFRVFLPITFEAVPQISKPVSPALRFEKGFTVLLVDDEQAVRNVVKRALKHFGFEVLTASNGLEAVELFQTHADKIQLALCDLTMPRMNGWETLTALRKLSPNLPVILSSGYNEAQALAGQHSELPQAFLSKPYVFDELRDVIARVLEKQKTIDNV